MSLPFTRLRTRLLVLATLPLAGLLLAVLWLSHGATTRSIEDSARGRLDDAASVFIELVTLRHQALETQARVTASDPRFFATLSVREEERDEDFLNTMRLLSRDFLQITDASFLELYGRDGQRMIRVVRDAMPPGEWSDEGAGRRSILIATRGRASSDALLESGGALLVADVPVLLGYRQEAVLRLGRWLDDEFAREVSRLTGARLALGRGSLVTASTFPPDLVKELPLPRSGGTTLEIERGEVQTLTLGDRDFLVAEISIAGLGSDGGFSACLGRSTATELAPLRRNERVMAFLGLLALAVTVGGSLLIALGVTKPLNDLVRAAARLREGDYAHPVPIRGHDEVGVLARSFEETRLALRDHVKRLEDHDQRKSEFLTLAGHELRTPLTVITSFSEILQSGTFGELPVEVTETTELIHQRLSHLNELVADIIDLSALEQQRAGALQLRELELVELFHAVEREQAPQRRDRTVEFRWTPPEREFRVRGDERLLKRAVRALLDNAVRFTPDGGFVELSIQAEDGRVLLLVRDSGIGIRPEDIRWIFEKFYEAGDIEYHSSGQLEFRSGGMGMGLSIARAVASAHGGELQVESRPHRGSCFTLSIPLLPGAPANSPSQDDREPVVEETGC